MRCNKTSLLLINTNSVILSTNHESQSDNNLFCSNIEVTIVAIRRTITTSKMIRNMSVIGNAKHHRGFRIIKINGKVFARQQPKLLSLFGCHHIKISERNILDQYPYGAIWILGSILLQRFSKTVYAWPASCSGIAGYYATYSNQ